VRQLCSERGIVLILDEIQTGLGRTGKLLAEEHEGIEADVTLIGKALAGGFYPVSAVLSNSDVLGVLQPGQHGSTFGGNPLACAVARAALKALVEEGMIANAREQGEYFKAQLVDALDVDRVREVRGRGLMLAIELAAGSGGARRVCEALREHGVLAKDTHQDTIRIAPPLVITREQVDWAVERFVGVIKTGGRSIAGRTAFPA
jgi:ornithine--oxo-acid transaminase